MRIALVNSWNHALSWFFYSQGVSTPPYGMCRVAANLSYNGHDVIIFDGQMLEENVQSLGSRIHNWEPDIIVVGAFPELHIHTFMGISAFPYDVELCKFLRALRPSCTILLGGYIPRMFPERTARLIPEIDGIISTQAELRLFTSNDVLLEPALTDSEVNVAQGYKYLVPDIYNYGVDQYLYIDKKERDVRPVLPILTATGCPHRCTFCATPQYFKHEHSVRNLEDVLNEIKEGVNLYGITSWSVWDDTFTVYPARVRLFCEELIKAEIDITWWCFGHARFVVRHPELLGIMKEAGCRMMWLGIESVDEHRLADYHKGISNSEGQRAAELILENGMLPTTSFIVGEPDENPSSLERRIKMSEKFLKMGCMNVYTLLIPVPGTTLFEQLYKSALIEKRDLRLYSGVRSVVHYENLTAQDLEDTFFSAYTNSIFSDQWESEYGRSNLWKIRNNNVKAAITNKHLQSEMARLELKRMRNIEHGVGKKVDSCQFIH